MVAVLLGALLLGGWGFPVLICTMPDAAGSAMCGDEVWLLALACGLLSAVAIWAVLLRRS